MSVHHMEWRARAPFAHQAKIKLNGNGWAERAPSRGDTFYREVLIAQNCQTVGAAITAAANLLGWTEQQIQGHLRWIATWPAPDGGYYAEIG